jgi:hypothetical protein
MLKVCNIIHWLALALWLSALVAAGVAAMNVFPTTDKMPLTLDGTPVLEGVEHNRILAGRIMNGVSDVMQFICIPLVVVTTIVQSGAARRLMRKPARLVHAAAVLLAAGLFTLYAFFLAPPMNDHLHAFWEYARSGNASAAIAERDAFNQLHPTADAILRINLLLVLAAIAAAAAIQTPPMPARKDRSAAVVNPL